MKDLKIGMNILATTTCMVANEVFKLHPTTLVDAYESDNARGLQISLGKGHWGACPSRSRERICINQAEVIKLAKKELETHISKTKDDKPKSKLYFVQNNNGHSITINVMRLNETVKSLAEGSYKVYRGDHISMKVNDASSLPKGYFYNIDEAIEFFSKTFSF